MRKDKWKELYEQQFKINTEQKNTIKELQDQVTQLSALIESIGMIDDDKERIAKVIKECSDLKEQWKSSISEAKKAKSDYEELYHDLLKLKGTVFKEL